MLINNMRIHREKYSKQHSTPASQQLKARSSCKIIYGHQKTEDTQNPHHKQNSEKKLETMRKKIITFDSAVPKQADLMVPQRQTTSNMIEREYDDYNIKTEIIRSTNRKAESGLDNNYHRSSKTGSIFGFAHLNKVQSKTHDKAFLSPSLTMQKTQSKNKRNSTSKLSVVTKISSQRQSLRNQPENVSHTRTQRNTGLHNYKHVSVNLQKKSENTQGQEQIVSKLKFNQVFFCAFCFRYVFGVQKNYHYPKCSSPVMLLSADDAQLFNLGIQRLELLIQLSQYTKCKAEEINAIYLECKKNRSLNIAKFEQMPERNYLQLSQIQNAAYIIVSKLILPFANKEKHSILCGDSGVYSQADGDNFEQKYL